MNVKIIIMDQGPFRPLSPNGSNRLPSLFFQRTQNEAIGLKASPKGFPKFRNQRSIDFIDGVLVFTPFPKIIPQGWIIVHGFADHMDPWGTRISKLVRGFHRMVP